MSEVVPDIPERSQIPAVQEKFDFIEEVKWLLAGWVMPSFSLSFYRQVARRKTIFALIFFFVFMLVFTLAQTGNALSGLVKAGQEIEKAFDSGEIPDIKISGGVAEVSSPQPRIFMDKEDVFFAIDTTGIIRDIDESYEQGILLTRTDLIVLNKNGRYQKVPLEQLQEMLGEPFILNREMAQKYWQTFATILIMVIFLGIGGWNWLGNLIVLLLLSLAFWGISSLFSPGSRYKTAFVTGIYALVPVQYIRILLDQGKLGFFGVGTLILIAFWIVGMIAALIKSDPAPEVITVKNYLKMERPVRLWRAWIGLPLVIYLILEKTFQWNIRYVSLPLTILTLLVFVGLSIFPYLKTFRPQNPGTDGENAG